MIGLTPKQKQVLDFIRRYIAGSGGIAPTFDEIAAAVGLKAKSGVSRIIDELEARGHVRRNGSLPRSLEVINEAGVVVSLARHPRLVAHCRRSGRRAEDVVNDAVSRFLDAMPATAVATLSASALPMRNFLTAKGGNAVIKLPQRQPTTIANSETLQVKFDLLAAEWRKDTQFYSSVTDMVLHPAYQQIIGQGDAVVPFILRELRRGPDHWYWALGAITQANPAQNAPAGDIGAICNAWLDWGERRGLVR